MSGDAGLLVAVPAVAEVSGEGGRPDSISKSMKYAIAPPTITTPSVRTIHGLRRSHDTRGGGRDAMAGNELSEVPPLLKLVPMGKFSNDSVGPEGMTGDDAGAWVRCVPSVDANDEDAGRMPGASDEIAAARPPYV